MQGPPPRNADPRVLAAIEAVYDTLDAPNPRVIEGCPCCIKSRNPDVLLTTPRREIAPRDLSRYISGVFYTVGGPRDFRYLVPRILEATVLHPGETPNKEIALGKLRLAEWENWSKKERAAIVALIDAWFDSILARDIAIADHCISEVEEILCGAARADLDIAPWLKRLAAPGAQAVRTNLAAFFARDIERGRIPGFWQEAPDGWAAFARTILA